MARGHAPQVPLLDFPQAWADIRIANPDAPENRRAMRLALDGRETLLTPAASLSAHALQPSSTTRLTNRIRDG